MFSTTTTPDEQGTRMRDSRGFRGLGALVWRRKWIALLVFALVANAVAASVVLTQRAYTATAEVAATPPAGTAVAPAASYPDLLGTLAEVASSRPVLEAVSRTVPDRSVEELLGEVKGEVLPGTLIVRVSVSDPDPETAALIANRVVAELPAHDPSNGAFVVKVSEPAVRPLHFSSPNIPLVAALGSLLALLAAAAAAAVTDRIFRTVGDAEELADVSGTVVLGVIPKPSDADGVQAAEIDADEFQSLRALRIAVDFASAEDPTRLLVCASAASVESWPGWLEVNLAAALAEVGHRVLVVNADRDSHVHPALEAADEPGLYDVLVGTRTLEETVRKGPVADVDVLPLGNAHLAAPSLLEMRFRNLLEDSEADYDVVLVHASPVASSEDARIIAIHGALLLTVPARKVHPRFVHAAAEQFRMIRVRVLGSVLIGSRPARTKRRAVSGRR